MTSAAVHAGTVDLRGADLHALDDRDAMGLVPGVHDRMPDGFAHAARELGTLPDDLVAVVEDAGQSRARRLAAGTLLALVGDPRIRTEDPALVRVPGGTFRMGATTAEVERAARTWAEVGVRRDWLEKEEPQHVVALGDVVIMRYPVTHLEWLAYLTDTDTGSAPGVPTSWRFGMFPHAEANHPVWTVEAEQADDYARWLSRRTGRSFRLPTEAEWEYVAGGGADGPRAEFPWGDEPPTAEHANLVEHGPVSTTPVGCHPAGRTVHGVHDLAGNVEEYVADDYRPYPGAADVEDDLARHGTYRIARGGAFTRFGDLARIRRRHGRYPRPLYAVGFRLVEDRPSTPIREERHA
ncbi:SUMF1/EgtB/PvdO family nonheme iron enzyme [Actinomycetospora corticicola]|uniref:Formylglycine-generating enzyme required for sulfatase activity n=1 Tax=Actinomycetospora corticicola TaxID=663602 RepID=A0A7Y9DS85_9PSEU|nr:SUMF1/EgtB/PvdO family nonheme iron enzyme [Actinomycetospora corticicola]NYD34504.1 formylglycine-generating enzyme required for sulfatase activity [Actinomycetospora corticicola]